MRAPWLPLVCLSLLPLVLPAHAASKTERIRLSYVSALEVERMLLGLPASSSSQSKSVGGGLHAPGAKPNLLHPGLVALAVHPEGDALTVSGSDEAIEQVRKIVRLLDVPQRRVRIALSLLQVDAAAAAGLPVVGDAAPQLQVHGLDEVQSARLLAQAKVQDRLEFTTANNQPVRLFWNPSPRWRLNSVIPRVNGDGSVMVVVPYAAERPAAHRGESSGGEALAFRIAGPPVSTLLYSEMPGPAVLLRVEALPPAAR